MEIVGARRIRWSLGIGCAKDPAISPLGPCKSEKEINISTRVELSKIFSEGNKVEIFRQCGIS